LIILKYTLSEQFYKTRGSILLSI